MAVPELFCPEFAGSLYARKGALTEAADATRRTEKAAAAAEEAAHAVP